jgi:hypothetical protein
MEEWTERKVQLKIYATILSCVYWINNSPLDIDVFLKNTFSTMRFDISDERVIISKGDPKEPAYLISKPNFFYNCLLQEFHQVSGQAEKLNLLQADHPFTELLNEDGVIPAEILATQFAKIGISDSFTTKEAEYIVQNAKPDFRRCKLQPAIV